MQPFQCDLQTQTQETHRTTYTGTSSVAKHIEGTKRPHPHPPHRRGTFHRRLQPLYYTEKHKVSCSGFLPRTKPMQHSCSHSNAICKHKLKKRIELRTQEHPVLQNTLKERNDPSRTRRTDEVPFIVACSHFTRKNTRFRAHGFLPTTKPMQHSCSHSQCDLQTQTQETHRTTYTGTSSIAKHIEGTKRPQPHPPHRRGILSSSPAATLHGKTQGFVLRLPPHNKAHATFMQPFQCDLQTQTQETHRTTYTGTSSVAKHIEGTKRPQPHPPHRRGTFHRRLQPLYTEKHKVSCSGFLPTTKPMQHSCSHSNAICKDKVKKRIELRTQEHPVLQNTLKERNDPSRTRRTDEVPFIVACSHFTRKNTRFRAPASSPQQSPCNIHAAIPMRSANTNSRNA